MSKRNRGPGRRRRRVAFATAAAKDAEKERLERVHRQNDELTDEKIYMMKGAAKYAKENDIPSKTSLPSALGGEPDLPSDDEDEDEFEGLVGLFAAVKYHQPDGVLRPPIYLNKISEFARTLEVCWEAHLPRGSKELTQVLGHIKEMEKESIQRNSLRDFSSFE